MENLSDIFINEDNGSGGSLVAAFATLDIRDIAERDPDGLIPPEWSELKRLRHLLQYDFDECYDRFTYTVHGPEESLGFRIIPTRAYTQDDLVIICAALFFNLVPLSLDPEPTKIKVLQFMEQKCQFTYSVSSF